MKLSELTPCVACGGPLPPLWYVLDISQAMLHPQATRETLGLTQMLGGHLGLAEVMAARPDEAVVVVSEKDPSLGTKLHVCQDCFLVKWRGPAQAMDRAKEPE